MRTVAKLGLCLLVAAGLVGVAAHAGEGHDHGNGVTVSGNISCGKCTLNKADLKECQDILVVAGEGGSSTEYWLVKNEVMDKFGHGCKGTKAATVTGSVAEKDGKKWLTATKIEGSSKG